MLEKIRREDKKRFRIMIYVVIPIGTIVGTLIGVGLIHFVSPDADLKDDIFIIPFFIVAFYIYCVFLMYRAFMKQKCKHETAIAQGKASDVGEASRFGKKHSFSSPSSTSRKSNSP